VGDDDRARGYSITQIHDRFGVPSTDCGMRYSPAPRSWGWSSSPGIVVERRTTSPVEKS